MKQFFLASLLGSSIALCTTAMAADTDLKALEDAARKEGVVNSVGMPDAWANWKGTWDDLAKKYGLKHIDTDMSSAQEVAKFEAEKDNASADIGDVGAAFGPIAVTKGVTQPYKPSTWAQIPDWAKDKDGHWALAYTGTIAFIINKQLVKEQDMPKTWHDLEKGKYKVAIGDVGTAAQAATAYWPPPLPTRATRRTSNRACSCSPSWPSKSACRWPTRPSRPWRRARSKSVWSGTSTA